MRTMPGRSLGRSRNTRDENLDGDGRARPMPAFMFTLLTNPVAVAGAMLLQVHMQMVRMGGIGSRAQDRREPSAACPANGVQDSFRPLSPALLDTEG